ncbi:adenosine deaminase [Roseisolibacter agri]|uniref:adenosine deaminase n=1 Tax=Roseisolibacter agri TaxID=2014610 RepID=A0AA37QJI6_9BACT|nr:adenosine deaminase [Roseisolibacter agri]GLC28053.1 adenosine deaminase [Roseisolibacter agri]
MTYRHADLPPRAARLDPQEVAERRAAREAAVDRTLLARLPKAELHCHLDGSVRPETLIALGAELGVRMPAATPEALREYMRVDDARNLEDYLARFDVTLSVMQTEAALERIAYELAVDAAAEGVRYLETRFAPVLNTSGGLSLGATVEAPLRGLARAERETGIVARVIVCGIRNMDPEVSLELSRLAVEYRNRGVVGFDLAGGEAGNPASRHLAAFEHARNNDLAITCHAGEGAGAESVRDALHTCGAERLGHATRLIEDPALVDEVGERRICCECCLTSNVQTRAAHDYASHPFRRYFDLGLNVVLNTDNRLMSGTTLVDEYVHAAAHLDFTFDELSRVALNGFESAFLPAEERRALIARVERDLAALRADGREVLA